MLISGPPSHLRTSSVIILEIHWLQLTLNDLRAHVNFVWIGRTLLFVRLLRSTFKLLDERQLSAQFQLLAISPICEILLSIIFLGFGDNFIQRLSSFLLLGSGLFLFLTGFVLVTLLLGWLSTSKLDEHLVLEPVEPIVVRLVIFSFTRRHFLIFRRSTHCLV
jgi:hypothetical protein